MKGIEMIEANWLSSKLYSNPRRIIVAKDTYEDTIALLEDGEVLVVRQWVNAKQSTHHIIENAEDFGRVAQSVADQSFLAVKMPSS